MPEISLLPSIAAPVTPAAPAGASAQPADAYPDPTATPSFVHRLRAAMQDAQPRNARAHHPSAPESHAQHSEQSAQVRANRAKDQDGETEASVAGPTSTADGQQSAIAELGTAIPIQAVMPAMAPLPAAQAGVPSSPPSMSGTDAAQGLALARTHNGTAQLAFSALPAEPLAPSDPTPAASATPGQNPADASAPAAPAQPSGSDAQQLAAIPAPAPTANAPVSASDSARPAAPTHEPVEAVRDGAVPQQPPAAPTVDIASAAPASGVLPGVPSAGTGPTPLNSGAFDAPRSNPRGTERGAPAHGTQAVTSARRAHDATGAQVILEPSASNERHTATDQHSSADSGPAATTSDETLSTPQSASADAGFATHLTNAHATTSPLAGSSDVSAHATDVATQIAHQADLYRLPGGKGVRIQLHPDDLGGLDVTLRYSAAGGVQLHINAEHAATGQLVQAGWTELRDALAATGITPDRLIMSVTAPSAGSGLDMSFNGQNGGRAGADLAGFSQSHSGQRQSSSGEDGAGATHTWFSDADVAASAADDRARGPVVAASSHIDYRV